MTLSTRPEEIYRALIEATAYGTRMIVDTFVKNGVPVTKFVATGGISQKNAMAMQIYADVLNMPVYIADGKQGGAWRGLLRRRRCGQSRRRLRLHHRGRRRHGPAEGAVLPPHPRKRGGL